MPQAAIVNQLAKNTTKLALICAVSRNPAHPTITEVETGWDGALAEHSTRTLLRDAGGILADNEFEKRLNQANDIIRKHFPYSRRDVFLTTWSSKLSHPQSAFAALPAHEGAGDE